MKFTSADEAEVLALRAELAAEVCEINLELSTANLWLWSFASDGADARGVLNTLFEVCDSPVLVDDRQNAGLWPWVTLTPDQAREAAVRYLIHGVCLEIPAFPNEPAA